AVARVLLVEERERFRRRLEEAGELVVGQMTVCQQQPNVVHRTPRKEGGRPLARGRLNPRMGRPAQGSEWSSAQLSSIQPNNVMRKSAGSLSMFRTCTSPSLFGEMVGNRMHAPCETSVRVTQSIGYCFEGSTLSLPTVMSRISKRSAMRLETLISSVRNGTFT